MPLPRIEVEIYGHYADLAGWSKGSVEIQDATVRGLVAEMKRTWRRSFVEAVLDEEEKEFNLGVLVMVNSYPVYHLQGMDTILAEGDKVIFLPPMAGGGDEWEILPGISYQGRGIVSSPLRGED